MTTDLWHWGLTVLSVTGALLVALRRPLYGHIVWTVANPAWCILFASQGMLAEAALFFVYLCVAAAGVVSWLRTGLRGEA